MLASDAVKVSERCYIKIDNEEFKLSLDDNPESPDTSKRDSPLQEEKKMTLEPPADQKMLIENLSGDKEQAKKSEKAEEEPAGEKFLTGASQNVIRNLVTRELSDISPNQRNVEKKASNDVFAYFDSLFDRGSEENSNSKKFISQSEPPSSKKDQKFSEEKRELNFSERIKKTTPFLAELVKASQSPQLGFRIPENQRTISNDNQKMSLEEPKQNKDTTPSMPQKKIKDSSSQEMLIEEPKIIEFTEIKPEPKLSQEKPEQPKLSQEKVKRQSSRAEIEGKTPSQKTPNFERESSKSDGEYDAKEMKLRFDEDEKNHWSVDEILDYKTRTPTLDFVCKDIGNSKFEGGKALTYSQEEKKLQDIETKFSPFKGNIKKISSFIDILFGDDDDDENSRNLGDVRQKKVKK